MDEKLTTALEVWRHTPAELRRDVVVYLRDRRASELKESARVDGADAAARSRAEAQAFTALINLAVAAELP